jgi:hypothetical protein
LLISAISSGVIFGRSMHLFTPTTGSLSACSTTYSSPSTPFAVGSIGQRAWFVKRYKNSRGEEPLLPNKRYDASLAAQQLAELLLELLYMLLILLADLLQQLAYFLVALRILHVLVVCFKAL